MKTLVGEQEAKIEGEFDALRVLYNLTMKLVKDEFEGNVKMREYLEKRFMGAYEVLKRHSTARVTEYELCNTILSSKAMEEGVERKVKMKTLEGKDTAITVGVPAEEAFHHTRVSKFRFKCTCQDAIFLATEADSKFHQILINNLKKAYEASYFFSKYVICKHTLASMAKALKNNVISIDEDFLNTLRIALFAVYLKTNEKSDKQLEEKIIKIIKRRK